eukprot:3392743-Pyramimonas_sp.AAC.1
MTATVWGRSAPPAALGRPHRVVQVRTPTPYLVGGGTELAYFGVGYGQRRKAFHLVMIFHVAADPAMSSVCIIAALLRIASSSHLRVSPLGVSYGDGRDA